MITVVNENYNEVNDGYFNLTFAEACEQFRVDNINAFNEMQMDILLTEHQYLYENGVEIEYVDEAGNSNGYGLSLIDKIKEFFEKIKENIKKLWDKLINFIEETADKVRLWIQRGGMKAADASTAIKVVYSPSNLEILKIKKSDDKAKSKYSYIPKYLPAREGSNPTEVFSNVVDTLDKFDSENLPDNDSRYARGNAVDTSTLKAYYDDTFLNTDGNYLYLADMRSMSVAVAAFNTVFRDNYLKTVRDAKKKALKHVDDAIKRIKENNDGDMSDKIEKQKKRAARIAKNSSDATKIGAGMFSDAVNILRIVMGMAFEIRKKQNTKKSSRFDADLHYNNLSTNPREDWRPTHESYEF